jgi:hypothetical protein
MDGCGNNNNCGTCSSWTDAADKPLSSFWKCNPLLGKCQCYIKSTDPNSCESQGLCSGTDACGKPCASSCPKGPCNVGGTYSKETPDECVDCSEDCKLYMFKGCFDYLTINVSGLPIADGSYNFNHYQVHLKIPKSFSKTGIGDDIRFVNKNDRTKFYWHSRDGACSDGDTNNICFWVNIDDYIPCENPNGNLCSKTIWAISGATVDQSEKGF